jgi:hypothetical protein
MVNKLLKQLSDLADQGVYQESGNRPQGHKMEIDVECFEQKEKRLQQPCESVSKIPKYPHSAPLFTDYENPSLYEYKTQKRENEYQK